MNDHDFGVVLRDRLDSLADYGTPDDRPPLSSLDALPLSIADQQPAATGSSTRWWWVAAAAVVVLGAGAVFGWSNTHDEGAVATDPSIGAETTAPTAEETTSEVDDPTRALEVDDLDVTSPAPPDGVYFGQLDAFVDDVDRELVRIMPAEFFSGDEATGAAADDGEGEPGSGYYIRDAVASPVTLPLDPASVRITVIGQDPLDPVDATWDEYVRHLRGDDPFPIYGAGNYVHYTVEEGEITAIEAVYLP